MSATMTSGIAAASFAALAVGDRFEFTTEPVTTERLVRYAGAVDDYARIHYDLPAAIEAGLGGVIAHGMLTMAFMGRAVTDWAGPRTFVKRIQGKFVGIVRVGDAVHVVGTVLERRPEGREGLVRCALEADVGGRQVAVGEATLLFAPDS